MGKFTTLSVYVPERYKQTFEQVAEEQNKTVSEVFRIVQGLDEQVFNFDFSVKDKPIFVYSQLLSIIEYSMMDFMKTCLSVLKPKSGKHNFYDYLLKAIGIHYDYFDKGILVLMDNAFDQMTDNTSLKMLERTESLAYLIEEGTSDDWSKVLGVCKDIKSRKFTKRMVSSK